MTAAVLGARIRALRRGRGLTQARLADLAGVSRQLVGAVEAGRHLPRVDAAVALARVLGEPVEALLAPGADAAVGVVGPPRDGALVRLAQVGGQLVCHPAAPAGESWSPSEGVVRGGRVEVFDGARPGVAVAGCDPAIGLAARLAERGGGAGVVAVATSTATALAALAGGRVHAAVVHGRDGHLPVPPAPVRRVQVGRWRVGLAGAAGLAGRWWAEALGRRLAVVQREPGAGSQDAFERAAEATSGHPSPTGGRAAEATSEHPAGGRTAEATSEHPTSGRPAPPALRASGHLEAAVLAGREGCAAVSIEPAALALGLAFHPLEEHVCELWIASAHADAPGVRRFADELVGTGLRRRLSAIGGYDLTDCGREVVA